MGQDFNREEVMTLKARVAELEVSVVSASWKRMYSNLLVALDHLDAMIARTEVMVSITTEEKVR